jgi:hypothetical protein
MDAGSARLFVFGAVRWPRQQFEFWPDGQTITDLVGSGAIQAFYKQNFEDRLQAGKNVKVSTAFGDWKQTVRN